MRRRKSKQEKRVASLVLTLIGCCCLIVIVTSKVSNPGQPLSTLYRPDHTSQLTAPARPLPPPARWLGLIGEYGPDNDILLILEKDGKLCALFKRVEFQSLDEISRNVFRFPAQGAYANKRLIFRRDARGRATQVELEHVVLKRRQIEPESGNQLRVKPLRPVPEVMKEARAAQPPPERGEFREADLVELAKLDPTIRLEIRYATTNNFLGTVFYSEARAFMQRPAAEAVVRANRKLKALR